MGNQRFRTVRDDEAEEEIVQPRAEKLDEVERRFDARGAMGVLEVADFETQERETTVSIEQRSGRILSLSLTYDPSVLTESATQTIQDLGDESDPLGMAELFCRLVTSWKLYGPLTASVLAQDEHDRIQRDDRGRPVWERVEIVPAGEVVPLEPDIIQYLPSAITLGIWREIGKDVNPDPKPNRHARRASRRR